MSKTFNIIFIPFSIMLVIFVHMLVISKILDIEQLNELITNIARYVLLPYAFVCLWYSIIQLFKSYRMVIK